MSMWFIVYFAAGKVSFLRIKAVFSIIRPWTKFRVTEKSRHSEFISESQDWSRWTLPLRPCGKPDIFHKIKDFGKSSQTSSGSQKSCRHSELDSESQGWSRWAPFLRPWIKFRVTKNCRVGKVKRFPPPDCAKMGILGFQSCLESLPSRIRTQYGHITTTAPSPTREGLGWGTVI